MSNLFVKFNNANASIPNNFDNNSINQNNTIYPYALGAGCDGYPIRVSIPSSALVGASGIAFRIGGVGGGCCLGESGPLYSNIVKIIFNSVNFNSYAIWNGQNGNITTVGTNGGPSYYGTYDQGGNVNEWTDGVDIMPDLPLVSGRVIRGGGYPGSLDNIKSTNRGPRTQTFNSGQGSLGFRIASNLPGPSLVKIEDAGNANDDLTGYGSVAVDYYIGKYEITNSEYVEFLNAIASTDTYNLYNNNMATNNRSGISRSDSSGSYSYSTKANMCNKPINFASWLNAARYCNWLHNNKRVGSQNDTTTEDGAYTLSGLQADTPIIYKNSNAKYWIPTEDEWYKAAYYSPIKEGVNSPGYYTYATQSDTEPTCVTADNVGNGNSKISDYTCLGGS